VTLPPPNLSLKDTIALLAQLPAPEYDRVRRAEAQRLGIQVKTLDEEVKAARTQAAPADRLPFTVIEPWQDSVVPAQALDETTEIILRYVVMDTHQARAAALWIAMTWFIEVVEVAALALITAPEKACGKSQLLTILGYLVARPLPAANSTASFLFRAIELWQPTVLIDEADTFIRESEELKGIVNAGHTRANAYVGRTVSVGDSFEPRLFIVWGAKAFAGIALERHLPDATLSRGILFVLRRKLPHETVERLRHADRGTFDVLARKLARFALDYADRVRQARPVLPDALSDRAQDNWDALFAIADLAGPKWREYAEDAAFKMSAESEGAASRGNELLADIKEVFERKTVTRIRTSDLLEALILEDTEAPWATYNRGKPLTARQLGGLLDPYGIKSKSVRFGDFTPKGYELAQFTDAFARYLKPPSEAVTPSDDESPLDPDDGPVPDVSF
jgi:putative DNA primase/helicase